MIKKLLLATLISGIAFAAGPVYELRTYTAVEGKMDALVDRFRGETERIFKKHKMESVGYWVGQDPAKKNVLVYILKFPTREAGEQAWKDFQADPEWQKVQKETEAAGPLLAKPPERLWMDATDFSKLK
jgi:hypothetical protein